MAVMRLVFRLPSPGDRQTAPPHPAFPALSRDLDVRCAAGRGPGSEAGAVGKSDPWYFPAPAEYKERLENQGFSVSYIELIPRPTPLPGDIGGWLETFCRL